MSMYTRRDTKAVPSSHAHAPAPPPTPQHNPLVHTLSQKARHKQTHTHLFLGEWVLRSQAEDVVRAVGRREAHPTTAAVTAATPFSRTAHADSTCPAVTFTHAPVIKADKDALLYLLNVHSYNPPTRNSRVTWKYDPLIPPPKTKTLAVTTF